MRKCATCGKPWSEVMGSIRPNCNECFAAMKKDHRKQREADRVATMNAKYKYYIDDNTDLGDCSDEMGWVGYTVDNVACDSIEHFVIDCSISATDQDGGEVDCWDIFDAPEEQADQVLKMVGLTWDDLEDYRPAPRGSARYQTESEGRSKLFQAKRNYGK